MQDRCARSFTRQKEVSKRGLRESKWKYDILMLAYLLFFLLLMLRRRCAHAWGHINTEIVDTDGRRMDMNERTSTRLASSTAPAKDTTTPGPSGVQNAGAVPKTRHTARTVQGPATILARGTFPRCVEATML